MRTNAAGKCLMQTRGNDQLNPRFLHFPELPFRYTLLQGQEVLRANPVGFVNDLPPPVETLVEHFRARGHFRFKNLNGVDAKKLVYRIETIVERSVLLFEPLAAEKSI